MCQYVECHLFSSYIEFWNASKSYFCCSIVSSMLLYCRLNAFKQLCFSSFQIQLLSSHVGWAIFSSIERALLCFQYKGQFSYVQPKIFEKMEGLLNNLFSTGGGGKGAKLFKVGKERFTSSLEFPGGATLGAYSKRGQ